MRKYSNLVYVIAKLIRRIDQRMSEEAWASNNYDQGPTGYDDSPLYKWDENFRLDDFKYALRKYNLKDRNAFESNEFTIRWHADNPQGAWG